MAATVVNTNVFWKLAMFFNGPKGGWSEGHCLGDASASTTLSPLPANYVQLRQVLMGLGCIIKWIRLSRSDRRREDFQQLDGEVGPLLLSTEVSAVAEVNLDSDGVKFRLETHDGLHVNKGICGVRDGHIANRIFQYPQVLVEPSTVAYPPDLVAAAPAPADAYKLYMQWMLMNTFLVHRNPRGAATKYTLRNFRKILFRKTFAKRLGRPFDTPRGRAPALR